MTEWTKQGTGRSVAVAAGALAGLLLCVAVTARAEDADHDWQKEYPVSGNPTLTLETGDSGVEIHACDACKAVRIRVHSDESLSRYTLEERQNGDAIEFRFKEKPHVGMMNWGHHHTQVTVETPAKLELHARSSDGHMVVRGLEGAMEVHTSDGGVEMEDVHGALRVTSSDGAVAIRRAAGTLEARASDGSMSVDGAFTTVMVHTSDGNLDLALQPGAQLTAASRIESSDGRVSVKIPHDLQAMLDITTSDGRVDCSLPLTMDHYDSKESSGHHLHGSLNNGSVPLSIHTSDGSVSIASL